jgi:hypothetical protein
MLHGASGGEAICPRDLAWVARYDLGRQFVDLSRLCWSLHATVDTGWYADDPVAGFCSKPERLGHAYDKCELLTWIILI